MSGAVQPPVLGPAQIANLLERVVHERVLDAVDLLGVYRLELSIAAMIGDLDGITEAHAAELAAAMIDRAVQRLPDDLRCIRRDDDWLPDPAGCCFLCRGDERAAAAEANPDRPRGRPKR